MPSGQRAADVLLHVAVLVVQVPNAPQVAAAPVMVAARAVLAEPVAVSVHRSAHHAVVRLRESLAHVHGQGAEHEDANWTEGAVSRETTRVEVERGVGERLRARLR